MHTCLCECEWVSECMFKQFRIVFPHRLKLKLKVYIFRIKVIIFCCCCCCTLFFKMNILSKTPTDASSFNTCTHSLFAICYCDCDCDCLLLCWQMVSVPRKRLMMCLEANRKINASKNTKACLFNMAEYPVRQGRMKWVPFWKAINHSHSSIDVPLSLTFNQPVSPILLQLSDTFRYAFH